MEGDNKTTKGIANLKLSDFGLTRFLEREEIDRLTVAEYKAYERKLKSYRDWENTIDTAKIKARAEGLAEGREEGRKEQSFEIARQMKSKGILVATIVECTGLGEDEISRL